LLPVEEEGEKKEMRNERKVRDSEVRWTFRNSHYCGKLKRKCGVLKAKTKDNVQILPLLLVLATFTEWTGESVAAEEQDAEASA
jgi:hypothetical protein